MLSAIRISCHRSRCCLAHHLVTPLSCHMDTKPSKRTYSCITSQLGTINTNAPSPGLSHKCQHPWIDQRRTYISDIFAGMAQAGFHCFNTVHTITGAPWWLSIVLVVVPMRVGLQLIREYLDRVNTYRLVQVHLHMKNVVPGIKQMTDQIGSDTYNSLRKEQQEKLDRIRRKDFDKKIKHVQNLLYTKLRCHPYKGVALGVLHLPIWLSLSASLREMSGLGYLFNEPREYIYQASLHTEGALWFQDLVLPDPLFILPITAAVSMLTSIEINKLKSMAIKTEGPPPLMARVIDNLARCGCLVLLLFGAYFPAAMPFYWSLSSLSANVVTLVLLSPSVRKALNFKPSPFDLKTPYTDFYGNMKIRYNPRNWYENIAMKLSKSKSKDGENIGKNKDK